MIHVITALLVHLLIHVHVIVDGLAVTVVLVCTVTKKQNINFTWVNKLPNFCP